MVVSPVETLQSLARGEGDSKEMFLWSVVVAAAAAPTRFGQAILLARTDLVAGLLDLVRVLAERFGGALIGCLAASVVAFVFERRRSAESRIGFDRIFDITTFMLVPHFSLIAVGVLASQLGLELWFLPHRLPKGPVTIVAIRLVVAYVWSVGLFAVFLKLRSNPTQEAA